MRFLLLTDRRQTRRPLVEVVAEAGASSVVLREKDLPDEERLALALRLADLVPTLIVAGRLPGWPGATHLCTVDGFPSPRPPLVGRSCHDAAELAAAAAEGADYATVSPVFPTISKPGYGPALGLPALADLCAGTPVPVYALGGVTSADDVAACLAAGAAGVAVMGAVMRSNDPAAFVKGLLR